MYKSTIAFSLFTLALLELGISPKPTSLRLKEEAMTLEYSATEDQVALVMSGESEDSLAQLEIRDPSGASVLSLRAQGRELLAVSGFKVESREMSFASLRTKYAAGVYGLRARTVDGQLALGSAVLSYELPPTPTVTYPREGEVDVPTKEFTVKWDGGHHVGAYTVVLEQGENDGLSVKLPAGSNSFTVPDGILVAGTESHVEVGAIGHDGNITIVEVFFTTR